MFTLIVTLLVTSSLRQKWAAEVEFSTNPTARMSRFWHWTFECPMPNTEYQANFTFLTSGSNFQVWELLSSCIPHFIRDVICTYAMSLCKHQSLVRLNSQALLGRLFYQYKQWCFVKRYLKHILMKSEYISLPFKEAVSKHGCKTCSSHKPWQFVSGNSLRCLICSSTTTATYIHIAEWHYKGRIKKLHHE